MNAPACLSDDTFLVAAALAAASSLLFIAGLHLHRAMHRGRYPRTLGLASAVVVGGAVALYYYASSTAPAIFVAPLLAIGVFFNSIFSRLGQREVAEFDTKLATVIVFVGSLTMAASAASCEPARAEKLHETETVAFFGSTMALAIVVFLLLVFVSQFRDEPRFEAWKPFVTYTVPAMAAEFLSGAVLLTRAIALDDRLNALYVVVALLVVWGFVFLELALRNFETKNSVPIFLSVFLFLSVLGGGLVLGEFAAFDPLRTGLFALGAVVALCGTLLLAHDSGRVHAWTPVGAPVTPNDDEVYLNDDDEDSGYP